MLIEMITKRLKSTQLELDKEFTSIYTKTDFYAKLRELKSIRREGTLSRRPSVLRELFKMLDRSDVSYEKGKDDEYYEMLIEGMKFPEFSDVEKRIIAALYQKYQQYPSPEEYMKRIVDRLAPITDETCTDSVRLRILKKFIKDGNALKDAGYSGKTYVQSYMKEKLNTKTLPKEFVEQLDDGVFECLEDAKKAQLKPDGKFGLLKLADDLASGKFRTEGATKKGLYLFALVFGMTYYTGADGEIKDRVTDIEINLFQDYYKNNLMRFVSKAYLDGKTCEFEMDPCGQGINYKNFAEMVYLYYLNKDYSPAEKIKRAMDMIRGIEKDAFKRGKRPANKANHTRMYKTMFCESILEKTEEEFRAFLLEHYDCDTYSGISYEAKTKDGKDQIVDGKFSEIQIQTEQNTAYEKFNEILSKIEKLGIPLKACDYGLWFSDVNALKKKFAGTEYEPFIEVLFRADNLLKNRHLNVKSAKDVTRTAIITAYYYYYNALYEYTNEVHGMSFEEVFKDFENGVNTYLQDCFYQPLSGKNIFDVLMVFSAYAYYLNI